jgi:DNA (cytosine-5)-methyltransferase 1
MKKIKIGTDFSGVGSAEYAIDRVAKEKAFEVENVFACDMDKYARISYLANHKTPSYFPNNVYNREIPKDSLDIYVSSPPCQSFSLAGKRLGKEDSRGILFFNTHEFIVKNKPRYFIIENVKGLLSDDGGKTFNEWTSMLGGKSVNGIATFFPHEEAAPYHIYWKVLNAKHYNVPQNRERVFIVGIREDADNTFSWPKEEHLTKRLKDVLEHEVDEKYFLSDKMVSVLMKHENKIIKNETPNESNTIHANYFKMGGRDQQYLKVGTWRTHKDGQGFRECEDGNGQPVIQVKSATSKGYEEATIEDSINFSNPQSKTRRGRVEKGVAQTLDTSCNQGVIVNENSNVINPLKGKTNYGWHFEQNVYDEIGITRALKSSEGSGNKPKVIIENKKCIPVLTPDRAEKRQNGRRFKEDGDEMFTITTQDKHGVYDGYRIRRLTPTECFRLMDFPDSHVKNARKEKISDSQLYKQAGNSIVVRCLELIMQTLNF